MKLFPKLIAAFCCAALVCSAFGALIVWHVDQAVEALEAVDTQARPPVAEWDVPRAQGALDEALVALGTVASGGPASGADPRLAVAEAARAVDAIAVALAVAPESADVVAVNEARASIYLARSLGVALLVVPFALAFFLGLGIARTLGRRLARIGEGARAIGSGDLGHRIGDTSGDEVGQLARALDETAAALAESTVSQEHLDAIIESMADPLGVVDGEGVVRRVNRAAAAIFERPADEVTGMHVTELFAAQPEELMAFMVELQDKPAVTGFSSHFLRADGTRVPVRISAAKLPHGPGEAPGLVVVAQDVTEVREAHDALRVAKEDAEDRQRLVRTIVDAIPDFIYAIDREGRYTLRNRAAAAVHGYDDPEAMEGLTAHDLFDRETAEAYHEADLARMATGEPLVDDVAPGHDGRWLMTTQVPLRDADGTVTGLVGIARDITSMKEAEADLVAARDRAEAATRAKSEFLANMSHEIRTPLNGVVGMTGLLLDTDLTPEQEEFASVIRSSGEGLLSVINDILDFSKIEAGMMELESQPFPVHSCLEDAIDLVAYRAAEKGVELAYFVDERVPARVAGDATRLRQVLVNLLANAVKFTEAGEVVVEAGPWDPEASPDGAETPADRPAGLHIRVRDTGIGIPPDKMEALFAAFTQADASTTRRYGGTGLGLAIASRLVEAMGGRIWAESEVGAGTTFHVVVPAEPLPDEGPAPVCPGIEALRGCRMLIVDDTPTNRRILQVQAERWGLEPVLAASADEALAALEGVDVAVLDLQMPDVDGATLAAQIAERQPGLPLVLLSSMHLTPALPDGLLAATLLKPIKPSHLCREVVRAVLAAPGGDGAAAPFSDPPLDPEAEASEAGASEVERPEADGREPPIRILVAEDNPVNQRVVRLLLGRHGHRADVVADGGEVLPALERQAAAGRPYDLVLMDVRMPCMDGIEAAQAVRASALDPQPRIVAMTADVTADKREACFAAGMDGFLSKPVDRDALAATLRRVEAAEASLIFAAPAPPPTPEAFPTLLEAAQGDGELTAELLRGARSELDQGVRTLKESLQRDDLGTVAYVAHSLKAMTALLDAAPLAAHCASVQEAAEAGDLVAAVEAFLPLHAGAKDLLAALDAELVPEASEVA